MNEWYRLVVDAMGPCYVDYRVADGAINRRVYLDTVTLGVRSR